VRRRRKERKQFVLIDFFVASQASASYSAISAVDAAMDAERILADAPPAVREALMMRYGSSESWEVVATRTGTSRAAIRMNCKRFLDRIRQELGILGAPQ